MMMLTPAAAATRRMTAAIPRMTATGLTAMVAAAIPRMTATGLTAMIAAAIPRMTTPGYRRMVAPGIPRMTAGRHSPRRSCHRCGSISSLRVEACPPYRIHRRRTRTTAIGGCKLVAVKACRMVVIELFTRRLYVILPHRRLLLRIRLGAYTRAAIKADTIIHHGIVDDGPVDIRIVNDRGVDIHYGRIVPEVPAMPFPPDKPRSPIAVTIIDTAIKSDMRSPIPSMPAVDAAGITPITRCP